MRYLILLLLFTTVAFTGDRPNIGDVIDAIDGVPVYFNGDIENVLGRNVTNSGYNLGLRYQCVEFVKRYYYDHLKHEMPYSYGHAKDFFDRKLSNSWRVWNKKRSLYQYRNGNYALPLKGDILVFGKDKYNPYGHIGIISEVGASYIEIIQQNHGRETRTMYRMVNSGGKYYIANEYALGWLRQN